nr:MAG TPA: putative membrane protein [Caudoviricetes sp.]
MPDKLAPEITPQLAISAFTVLHQYCSSISPHDCNRCAFYKHCSEYFMGCPGDQGEMIRKLQSNE